MANTNALQALRVLDSALVRVGESVTIRRPGASNTDVVCLAKVDGVNETQLRKGSSSVQGNFRAILSPTPLSDANFPFPLRATDKIVRGGIERQITFVNAKAIGTDLIRIEIDFVG